MNRHPMREFIWLAALAALLTPCALHATEPDPAASPPPQQAGRATGGEMGARAPGMARRHAMRQAFSRLDRNGDGKIDLAEFQAPRQDLFARADSNEDGAVTLEELKQYRERRAGERLEQRFARLDADGDGRITREEIQQQRFAAMDRDGDGYLSPREMLPRRGPRPAPPDDRT